MADGAVRQSIGIFCWRQAEVGCQSNDNDFWNNVTKIGGAVFGGGAVVAAAVVAVAVADDDHWFGRHAIA